MRSIIENIKEIEEENLKEVISLTNENDELKRKIAGLEKDIEGTETAIKSWYDRGFFDCILRIKKVVDQIYRENGLNIGHKCNTPKNNDIDMCRK